MDGEVTGAVPVLPVITGDASAISEIEEAEDVEEALGEVTALGNDGVTEATGPPLMSAMGKCFETQRERERTRVCLSCVG